MASSLTLQLYRFYLRLPGFSGKSRLEGILRQFVLREKTATVSDGLKMRLDPVEWSQRDLLATGRLEPMTTALFGAILKEGDTFVDVGCHVGYHTLVARRLVGPRGRVIAIDPQPYNCENVLANWRVNDFCNLSLYVAAVGETEETVRLSEQPPTDKSRLSLLEPRSSLTSTRQFSVPLRRLESIFQEEGLPQIKLLKIDTEGFEYRVLKGLGNSIERIENIVLELLPETRNQSGAAVEMCLFLEEAGYDLRTIDDRKWNRFDPLPENNLWARRSGSVRKPRVNGP